MSTHDDIKVEEIENLDFEKYEDKYSEAGLWDKIRKNIAKIGVKVIYQALLLYYVAQSTNCPPKIKAQAKAKIADLLGEDVLENLDD